ncbi:MAG: hypothetical protein IJF07_04270 [Lachnospiraceae bacterium]|nr:hypothetical protein [Lachnospiraceae bacterium]
MASSKQILSELLYPSEEFTPIPFWFFNDVPDNERIRAQLADYKEKGVHAIVLHPRIGLPEEIGYLSKEYFAVVHFLVKTASEFGMKIVLYDEGMYPSGSAHGMVVAASPEYASKGITIVSTPGESEIICRLSGQRYLVYEETKGTIRGIHFGEDDGEEKAKRSADILNPDAVDLFIQLTHDRYYEELKEYFGNTIIAFFTDEPCALGRNAEGYREWVPTLKEELTRAGGKLEELEGLFNNQENATTKLYHKLIKRHLRENFYRKLSEWCEVHGIALMGHPEASDDVEEQLYFHIPGQDLILRRVSPETGGLKEFDSVQAKLSADIARHLGRRRNANECFGVCSRGGIPWYFKAQDMKWYIDWLGVRGVNLFVPHAFYYSVAGARKDERPPDVGPNNIWWAHYRKFSDYMKRLSWLMTDSVNCTKVAVLCDNNQVPYQELASLYENQIEFNYLPMALLAQGHMENGRLCIGQYQYELLLNVTDRAWDQRVQRLFGEESAVNIVHSVEEVLAFKGICNISLKGQCKSLRVSTLSKEATRLYLFSNEGAELIQEQISFNHVLWDKADSLIFVDMWKGKVWKQEEKQNAEYRSFALKLNPCETLLVILDKGGQLSGEVAVAAQETFLGDWTKRFVMQQRLDNQIIYEYNYQAVSVTKEEVFHVRGEEMIECFCNGVLADVSFWGPHSLKIGHLLREGKNTIRLVVTGNAANIYTKADISYGLFTNT